MVRWRAGVQCGHEGHAQSPRVCVRAWGWARPPPPPCPGRARRGAGGGRFHWVRPASRAGPGTRGPGKGVPPGAWRLPAPGAGRPALLDNETAGQVLREVLEELGGGPGAVGQLQLLQLLQLHQTRQARGGQQRAACSGREAGRRLSARGPERTAGGGARPASPSGPGPGTPGQSSRWDSARRARQGWRSRVSWGRGSGVVGVSPARDKRRKLLMARRCFSPKSCTWAGGRGALRSSARACGGAHCWGQA